MLKGEVDDVVDDKESWSDAAHHQRIDGEDPRQQKSFINVWMLTAAVGVPSDAPPQGPFQLLLHQS